MAELGALSIFPASVSPLDKTQFIPALQTSLRITALAKSCVLQLKGKQMVESHTCSRSRAGSLQIGLQMQHSHSAPTGKLFPCISRVIAPQHLIMASNLHETVINTSPPMD